MVDVLEAPVLKLTAWVVGLGFYDGSDVHNYYYISSDVLTERWGTPSVRSMNDGGVSIG